MINNELIKYKNNEQKINNLYNDNFIRDNKLKKSQQLIQQNQIKLNNLINENNQKKI